MEVKEKIECLNYLTNIIKSNRYSVDDLQKVSNTFFTRYQDLLHVSKVEIVSFVPTSIFDDSLVRNEIIAYSNNLVGENRLINNYNIDSRGKVQIIIYSDINYDFDEEEKEFVSSIASVLYLYFSKKKLETVIKETRYKDSQTGAYNADGLVKFAINIDKRNDQNKYVAVFSNVKNFKYINKKYNRNKSNIILKRFFENLSKLIDKDEFICRPGGDNFISIIKQNHLDEYLDELKQSNIEIANEKVTILSTVGYYINEIENTNIALKTAKKNKNIDIYEYDDKLKDKIMREKILKAEILNSLENKELINYYQPKVNCFKNEICGAEALVRWVKDGKVVYPGEFIGVLERTNKITILDYYVLRRACEDIKKWERQGLNLVKISVNFSMQHLKDPTTASNIIKIINEYGVDPNLIEIELTELTDFNDTIKMENFMKELQKENVSISMDDFGSGYSSINLLKALNYNVVKLDKKLVDSIEDGNKKNLIILKNVISMLKQLDMDVIVEGVESEKQIQILKENNCKKIQGYYYDKPLCEEEFQKRLERKNYYINR